MDRDEAVENYIAFDRSDPFTRARIEAHSRQTWRNAGDGMRLYSVAGYRLDNGSDAFYSAEVHREERSQTVDGREITWTVPCYGSIKRP